MQTISRREVGMAIAQIDRSRLAIIDIYLAFLDGAHVQQGTDMDAVFREIWELNSSVRKDFGWATILYLRNQSELVSNMFVYKMKAVAAERAYARVPAVLGGTARAYMKLGRLALRIVSPFSFPSFQAKDFQALAAYAGKK